MIKLNFSRFEVKMEQLTLPLGADIGNTKSATKEYRKSVEDNVIATNEKAMTSMDKINAKSETLWSGKALTGAKDVIRNYKKQFKEMQDLAKSPFATAKFKLEAQSALNKDKLSGFSGLKLKDAATTPQTTLNKMITGTESMGKKSISELARQQKELAKSTTEATVSISKFRTVISAAATAEDNWKKKMSSTLATLRHAAVSWRILYGAFSQIWNVLAGTVEKAAAYQEALNLYTVAMGEYAEAGTEWANRISSALFLDPKQILQYTGAFYNLTQGLGVSSDAAYKMSTNLTQLAYDMSSYLNIDVEAAHDKIQSAMTGQSRAVASAGIAMQQASLQELAYQMGIRKTVSEMTQAEKTYLRYIQIMRSTTNMQGDLARTIVTPENALRVVKQQFELLGRAIGQVFIPIIMAAIPYVMALTKALTALANKLSSMLGFKIAPIDYSSLKTVDTAVEDTFNNIGTSAGKGAKAVGDSINRTLAAFDELNVVESESKGAGGGGVGGVGGGGLPLGNFEEYLDGYDMLQGLTDELSKKTDAAYENLKKLWGVVKLLGAGFLVWKGLKLINTILGWVDGFKKLYTAGKGIPGLFKNFATGWKEIGIGTSVLGKLNNAFAKMLGPIGQFTVAMGTTVTAGISAHSIFEQWNGTLADVITKGALATTVIGGLATVALTVVGPWAAIATGIAGVGGAIWGVIDAKNKWDDAFQNAKLFDGVGVSIKALTNDFDKQKNAIIEYTKEVTSLKNDMDTTANNVNNARDALQGLTDQITLGNFDSSDTVIAQLQEATDNFKESIEKNKTAHLEYHNSVIEHMKEEGTLTKLEYDSMKASAEKYYSWLALSQSQYADELQVLDAKLATGKITQQEYNDELQKLNDKYLGIIEPIENAAEGLDNMYYIAASKIDLSSPEEMYDLVTRLKRSYDEASTSLESQKTVAKEAYETERLEIEKQLAPLQKLKDQHKELSAEQQLTYNTLTARLEKMRTEYEGQMKTIEIESEKLGGTYKNYMATIYGQISEAGKLADEDVKNTVKLIRDEMNGLVEFDTRKATSDLFKNFSDNMYLEGKKFQSGTVDQFKQWGITFSDTLVNSFMSQSDKQSHDIHKKINGIGETGILQFETEITPKWQQTGKNVADNFTYGATSEFKAKQGEFRANGESIITGTSEGMYSKLPELNRTMVGVCDEITKTCRSELDIHSPSGVFKDIGKNIMLGLISGIEENSGVVQSKLSTVVSNMKSQVANNQIDFNFNTNVETSFNKILSKLQSFTNKWRNGINDTLSKTAKAFGSIVLNAMNKLTYSAMGYINIPTFAQGGYPTSGDLFMANENGRAEYITSLGNRTAVANQDQMVQALTNAITESMSSLGNAQPGLTQIYIGNDKIYEGYGTYQNRQADRYGTTTIKI